ncbi:MCE family protein [Mycolicibacterium setense]
MSTKKRSRIVLVAVLAALLISGCALLARQTYFKPQTITADFSSAAGLYPGDEVRIAGVKVGTISAITAQPDHVAVTLEVDHDVRVPKDAKAVIVAQNLVSARYVQFAPLYRAGEPRLTDGGNIPLERTAVPIEWDEVKTQLSRLATELGPKSSLSSSAMGKFIDSAANAMDGNGEKLRQTFAQLSQLGRILADGSGDVVATIENLQTFVTALRNSSDELVLFQNHLATFSTVLDDSKSDLDAAMSQLSVAVGEVQRFVAGTRDKTAEQVQRLANVTSVLAEHRSDLENILHVAPTAFANAYNILNPNLPGAVGTFAVANFSNPIAFICSSLGSVSNVTGPETAKLCQQYLGPALSLLNFNSLPGPPINPYLQSSVTPDKVVYTDPALAPGGTGGAPPEMPPAVSAYTGVADSSPPGGATTPTLPELLLPAEGTPPS